MTNSRQELGHEGETRAARFLEARGYRIVARNVRADRVEIDLIVRRGTMLAFVEVKSRRVRPSRDSPGAMSGVMTGAMSDHGLAAEAVDERKQRRLRHGAHAWLAANPIEARRTRQRRFDVVTCLFADWIPNGSHEAQKKTTVPRAARWSIEHWEAAF
jgi:putative endonuclease